MVPEYDLWRLIWDCKHSTSVKINVKWVKGHQDEDTKGQKIHGPFQREVQLNIDMDEKA